MIFKYKGQSHEYYVIFSSRKTIELSIEATGDIKVKAPKATSYDFIESVLEKKGDWINEKVAMLYQRRELIKKDQILFLGKYYKLTCHYHESERIQVAKIDDELIIKLSEDTPSDHMKMALEKFYKVHLKKVIDDRIKLYETQIKGKYKKISIRNQKTRWGSCSSSGTISFNYRLLMAPLEIIDYIIVHELCHLDHMNHSKSYWKTVYKIMPDYKERQEWLKQHGHLLSLDWISYVRD